MTKQQVSKRMAALAARLHYDMHDDRYLSEAMFCEKEEGHDNYTKDAQATLGDAVLKLVLSEHFFDRGFDKGEITRRRVALENNDTLKAIADCLSLGNDAFNRDFFADEAPAHRRLPYRAHDFYLEAVIAAIYRDRGLAYVRDWILDLYRRYDGCICGEGSIF